MDLNKYSSIKMKKCIMTGPESEVLECEKQILESC